MRAHLKFMRNAPKSIDPNVDVFGEVLLRVFCKHKENESEKKRENEREREGGWDGPESKGGKRKKF